MMNWTDAWWQARQSWAYFRHAYRCGWNLYADVAEVADAWSQRSYAVAYTIVQVTPRPRTFSSRS